MKFGSQKENEYAVGHPNIKHSGAQTVHVPTSPTTLRFKEMENRENPNAYWTVSIQKSSLPLSVSSSAGEYERIRAWIAVIRNQDVADHLRRNWTASDFIQAEGCLSEPQSSDTM